VFLNPKGEPLVGYFGIGKLTPPFDPKSAPPAVVAHTPPEVLQGASFDAKSDVFAFAILAWEVMIGKDAFSEIPDQTSISDSIVSGRRPTLGANIPAAFAPLLERCWASDPGSRPDFENITAELSGAAFLLPGCDVERLNAYRSQVFEIPKPPQPPEDDDLIARQQQQIDELRASYAEEIEALRAVVAELRETNGELKAATRELRREVKSQTAALAEHGQLIKSYENDLKNAGLHAQVFRDKQQRLAKYSRQSAEKIELDAANLRARVDGGARSPRGPPP
jgi:hypothetical protein